MVNTERMPLLFSKDEVSTMALAIQKFFDDKEAIRTGKMPALNIDDAEIENMLTDGDAHIIDEAMLRNVANRLKCIEAPRSVNLVYLSWDELCEIHTVLAIALSKSIDLIKHGQQSPHFEEAREHDQLWALAGRFDTICNENEE